MIDLNDIQATAPHREFYNQYEAPHPEAANGVEILLEPAIRHLIIWASSEGYNLRDVMGYAMSVMQMDVACAVTLKATAIRNRERQAKEAVNAKS